jgi:hypothetical protein
MPWGNREVFPSRGAQGWCVAAQVRLGHPSSRPVWIRSSQYGSVDSIPARVTLSKCDFFSRTIGSHSEDQTIWQTTPVPAEVHHITASPTTFTVTAPRSTESRGVSGVGDEDAYPNISRARGDARRVRGEEVPRIGRSRQRQSLHSALQPSWR